MADDGHCKYTLLFALVMLLNVSLSTSVSLDLTELRNKVSKIKVHPRGNLWATGMLLFHCVFLCCHHQIKPITKMTEFFRSGHFMGKKSISNSQLQDSPFPVKPDRNIIGESGSSEDLKELITQEMLKVALQAQLEDPKTTRDVYNQVIREIFKELAKRM